jgi:hypothetical protein
MGVYVEEVVRAGESPSFYAAIRPCRGHAPPLLICCSDFPTISALYAQLTQETPANATKITLSARAG